MVGIFKRVKDLEAKVAELEATVLSLSKELKEKTSALAEISKEIDKENAKKQEASKVFAQYCNFGEEEPFKPYGDSK